MFCSVLERLADALLQLGSWAIAAADDCASPRRSALESLHDTFTFEAAARMANPLARLAAPLEGTESTQHGWPLQLRYRLCAAAATLSLGALPAAAAAVDKYPPAPEGQDEPDFELIGFRIYMPVCYASEVLDALLTLSRQIDADAGGPRSLGTLLQATSAGDARLLAGLSLVADACRDGFVNPGGCLPHPR